MGRRGPKTRPVGLMCPSAYNRSHTLCTAHLIELFTELCQRVHTLIQPSNSVGLHRGIDRSHAFVLHPEYKSAPDAVEEAPPEEAVHNLEQIHSTTAASDL